MNSRLLSVIGAGLSLAVMTSCDGLAKMAKKQGDIKYTVTPQPLEMHGDSVQFSVSGKFNPKLFAKKVTLTITPVIKYEGGEKALKPITLVGDKATGSGQKISFSSGGTFSYTSEKFAFEQGMRNAKLFIKATGQVKSKTKDFDPVELGEGTMATSLLVRHDEKGMTATDNYVRTTPMNQATHIYYTINKSDVRSSELKSDEMKAFTGFIAQNLGQAAYVFKGITVSAYASPDGETDKNENLAKDRASSASNAMMAEFKKNKNKEVTFGKEKSQYTAGTTREDWEGFRELMQQSTIADKDLILRVLTMYNDADQRRKEIKNLSKTYVELSDKILPKLRRAEIMLNVDKVGRNDEQIAADALSKPDSLSVEELIRAANMNNDLAAKVQILTAAERKYGSDWRVSNNLGVALLMQNKVAEAGEAFKRAQKNGSSQAAVMNNLGIIESKNGNSAAAMEYYGKAGSSEARYNMGIINIQRGQYADASSNFGDNKTFNKALAQLLGGSASNAKETLDGSNERDMAYALYLKAVAAARQGNAADAISNLKAAIEKDGSWKAYAKNDAEFIKLRSDSNFTALIN